MCWLMSLLKCFPYAFMRDLQRKLSLRKLELEQCKYFQGRVQLASGPYAGGLLDEAITDIICGAVESLQHLPASDTVLMAVTEELGCVSVFTQRVVFTSLLFRMPCIVRP